MFHLLMALWHVVELSGVYSETFSLLIYCFRRAMTWSHYHVQVAPRVVTWENENRNLTPIRTAAWKSVYSSLRCYDRMPGISNLKGRKVLIQHAGRSEQSSLHHND